MTTVALVGAFVALVLNGLMAGVFFAFSVAVMRGLDAAPAEHAVMAMQASTGRS